MKIQNKLLNLTAVATLFTLGITGTAQAATLVVPNNLATTEGNFQFGFLTPTPSRLQQVFAASQFASKPLRISQLALRPNNTNPTPFDFSIENIQINLSTTINNPDALSRNFADNVGRDDTQVFNGRLTASTANLGSVGGPKNFDILINFANPFVYDSSKGNLLLDIKKFTSEITGNRFDGEFTLGDSVSTIIAVGDANATVANPQFSSSLGIVAQFTATPIPESSSVVGVLTIGVFGGGFFLKRKKQNRENLRF